MKTVEELNALKKEVETLNKKLAELTDDELTQVSGGFIPPLPRAEILCRKEFNDAKAEAGLPEGTVIF